MSTLCRHHIIMVDFVVNDAVKPLLDLFSKEWGKI
jgi:hypothetical protein